MGTRHLTCVVSGGEYKVAQYGQWDGYPSGQGIDILTFLREQLNRDVFLTNLSQTFQPTEEQIKAWWLEVGHDMESSGGFVDHAIAKRFSKNHPSLSRDTGGEILSLIQESGEPLPVRVYKEFAADSLFCEWAYVVDFDKNTFEVFEGFNHDPLKEDERFYGVTCDSGNNSYHPVRHRKTYPLDSLPTDEEFLSELEPKEEDE